MHGDWYQREIRDPWARLLGPHSDVTTATSLACEPAPSSKTRVLRKHQVIEDTVKRTQHHDCRQRDWF